MKKGYLLIPLMGLFLAGCSSQTTTATTESSESSNTSSESSVTTSTSTTTTTTLSGDTLTVTYLNVAKADAIILEANDTFVIIDTGLASTSAILTDALEAKGCDKIDYLIITHFDKDHVGGAATLINEFEIDKIYTSYYTSESNETAYNNYMSAVNAKGYSDRVTILRETLTFDLGGATYTIYPPDSEEYSNDPSNNSSLAIKTTYGDRSFFFAGDAEKLRIKELIKLDIDCDVFKVPHHGGIEDNSDKLISAVSPLYSIITSSASELEDDSLVELLKNAGSEVYLTRLGTVQVETDGTNLKVTQE